MKNYLLILFLSIFFTGCAASVIKLDSKIDRNPLGMFGYSSERNFTVNREINSELKLLWSAETYGSFTGTSFTIYDETVFISDLSGRIYALDIYNGKQIGFIRNKGSIFGSPILYNFQLIFAFVVRGESYSNLIIYDFKQGKISNEIKIDGVIKSELVIADEKIFGITENGIVFCYTYLGEKVWEKELNIELHSSPAVKNNVLVIAANNGKIFGLNTLNGETKYINKISELPIFSGVSIIDNNILISDISGELFRINYETGILIDKFKFNGKIISHISADENNYYFGSTVGTVYSLSKNNFRLNWKKETDGLFNTPVLVTNNRLIINEFSGQLLILNKEGEIVDKIVKDTRMKMTPTIFDNKLFIGYDNGRIEVYEIN